MTCIFCNIVSGDISSHIIKQTDGALAILDAFPVARGHTLVIPKVHSTYLEEMDESVCAQVFELVREIAGRVSRVHGDSLVALHNGRGAGQEIPHVHIHIIPRSSTDGAGAVHSMFKNPPRKATNDELDSELAQLKS